MTDPKNWRPHVNNFQDTQKRELAVALAQEAAALKMPSYLAAAMAYFQGARRFLSLPMYGANVPVFVSAEQIAAIVPLQADGNNPQTCEISLHNGQQFEIALSAGEVYAMINEKQALTKPTEKN